MEAGEISDTITEAHGHHHPVTDETFRKRVGVFIGMLAMLLALTGLGGSAAMKQTINANIEASDDYSFYQARNIRQTAVTLAADQLEILAQSLSGLSAEAMAGLKDKAQAYRKTAQRWESDPQSGDGKKELLAKAKEAQAKRDHAQAKDENFEIAEALLQIAIVLASTSILTASRPLLGCASLFSLIGIMFSINGFLLIIHLP